MIFCFMHISYMHAYICNSVSINTMKIPLNVLQKQLIRGVQIIASFRK